MGDEELSELLNLPAPPLKDSAAEVGFAAVDAEFARKGVTLKLLWRERRVLCYPCSYGLFYRKYRDWAKNSKHSMRQRHAPGDKERRRLHEEHRECGHRDVIETVLGVGAVARVG